MAWSERVVFNEKSEKMRRGAPQNFLVSFASIENFEGYD